MTVFILYNTFQQFCENLSFIEFSLISNGIILFTLIGIFSMEGNLIITLMCFEIILVSLAFNFILISFFFAGSLGLVFGYLLLIIAGAESSLSLSILTSYFFIEQHINVEFMNRIKG